MAVRCSEGGTLLSGIIITFLKFNWRQIDPKSINNLGTKIAGHGVTKTAERKTIVEYPNRSV